MYREEYPLPVIANEVVVRRVRKFDNGSCSWFSPQGPDRGTDFLHPERGRVIPDGTKVRFGGEEYEYRWAQEDGSLAGIMVSEMLVDGDRLEIISVPRQSLQPVA